MIIDSFRGKYSFLSNFAPASIQYNGVYYPSVEHAFQAAKTVSSYDKLVISLLQTPGEAKRAGRCVQLRDDWDLIKDAVMLDLLRLKFNGSVRDYKQQLLATADAELIEGNNHNDCYWGVSKGTGLNKLGKLLEQVRQEMREDNLSD